MTRRRAAPALPRGGGATNLGPFGGRAIDWRVIVFTLNRGDWPSLFRPCARLVEGQWLHTTRSFDSRFSCRSPSVDASKRRHLPLRRLRSQPPALAVVAYPDGYHGQRTRGRESPDSVDLAVADSVRRFLATHGVWAYGAEGDLYLDVSEGTLAERFGDRLGPAMKDFLRITALQQTRPYAGDGSLMISWDGLGDRLALTDRFLSEHPGTPPYQMMKEWHGRHLGFYMIGGPNTPAFERRTKILDPRVRSSYQRYVTVYGSTSTGRLIAEYLAVIEKNAWVQGPPVLDFLRTRSGLDDHWVPRRK